MIKKFAVLAVALCVCSNVKPMNNDTQRILADQKRRQEQDQDKRGETTE